MNTPRFKSLDSRIHQLMKHLLPKTKPTGLYTPRQYDHVRAFRLLAHAEFEAFVEDRCEDVIKRAVNKWNNQQQITYPLAYLLAYYPEGTRAATPATINPNPLPNNTADCFAGRLSVARTAYMAYVRGSNNGIKEANLLQLLLPIGIDADRLDPLWLSTMSSYGTDRGSIAHSSVQVQHPPDPLYERQTINIIIQGLCRLDRMLLRLM